MPPVRSDFFTSTCLWFLFVAEIVCVGVSDLIFLSFKFEDYTLRKARKTLMNFLSDFCKKKVLCVSVNLFK